MASGVWRDGEKKTRPGFYQRFKSAADNSIEGGNRGVVAIPVTANWGPVNKVAKVESEQDLNDIYGPKDGDYTAYNAIRLALLGGARKVLGYRMTDDDEKYGEITLQDDSNDNKDVIKLKTKYPSSRKFNVTVRDNVVESDNKKELVLYEVDKKLHTFVFEKEDIEKAVDAINDDRSNIWIEAEKLDSGNDKLNDISNDDLEDGKSGSSDVDNDEYLDAMEAFEAETFNTFTLGGKTDSELQASVASWVDRVREEGKQVVAYMGGSKDDDKDPEKANERSEDFDSHAIVNVGVGAVLDDKTYSSAEVSSYVAGLGASLPLRESMTYHETPFDEVEPRLTNSEIIDGLESGTLLLVDDDENIKIEQGLNTLNELSDDQSETWKKIKSINILDSIATDTAKTANDKYVGKLLNNEDGQAALLSALKNYFEELEPDLLTDVEVKEDESRNKDADKDEFYWKWEGYLVDSMEFIYGTGTVK